VSTDLTRRDFLFAAAAASIGLALPGCDNATLPALPDLRPRATSVWTRTALSRQSVARVLADPSIPTRLQDALSLPWGTYDIGGMAASGRLVSSLLSPVTRAAAATPVERTLRRIAVAAGYLLHGTIETTVARRAERHGIDPAAWPAMAEEQAAEVARRLLPPAAAHPAAARRTLEGVRQRAHIAMHTLIPDPDRPAEWALSIIDHDATESRWLDGIAERLATPDRPERGRFVVAVGFAPPERSTPPAPQDDAASDAPAESWIAESVHAGIESMSLLGRWLDGELPIPRFVESVGRQMAIRGDEP